ncbi:helix-turn-helix domain-containing protein [Tengunoibacter tsumagoiensis]|uniref:Helix-turn-helix domain-containing protein n=1 Tax=Tengunoibacter tsumagoiensis TaxID=2014871 RepID=A0A402A9M8_9CHLR|nr:helix-turn-helix domain-containing protein [Tengunoibacter tsumagoiensis]GCE15877.1 hypothetical protein KTT_57360 [Tengunoibacter tsumagoiensis]
MATQNEPQEQGESGLRGGELLTVREVAKRLRVDTTTVRRWITHGLLEAIPLPHRGKRQGYRIKKQTLDKLLAGPPLTDV